MRDSEKKKLLWRNAAVADLILSVWTDRLPVRTSSYLKGMHWRDLHGEKVTQVTSEAKCLDCVRAPLATRRSSTLPCLSSSQLRWMRPAGTAPLSDNCNSSLCPSIPLTSPPCPSGSPGLINHTYNTAPHCRRGAVSSFHDLRSKCALQHTLLANYRQIRHKTTVRLSNETPGGAQPMAVFKCNEAANDQLIRLFVLGNGRLRVKELYSIRLQSSMLIVCYSLCKNPVFNTLYDTKSFFSPVSFCIFYVFIFSFNESDKMKKKIRTNSNNSMFDHMFWSY